MLFHRQIPIYDKRHHSSEEDNTKETSHALLIRQELHKEAVELNALIRIIKKFEEIDGLTFRPNTGLKPRYEEMITDAATVIVDESQVTIVCIDITDSFDSL
ncbi:hypothetical protein TNCV_3334601 [Trichonephila clavipes]|nr:hypothetical protein TNCV_3334601 [Trichonephila clavipes]